MNRAPANPQRRRAALLPWTAAEPNRCIACGERVSLDEHAVRVRGDVMHAGCALYRPRGASARA